MSNRRRKEVEEAIEVLIAAMCGALFCVTMLRLLGVI